MHEICLGEITDGVRNLCIEPPVSVFLSSTPEGYVARCEELGLMVNDKEVDGCIQVLCQKVLWMWDDLTEAKKWYLQDEIDRFMANRFTEVESKKD